MNENMDNTPEKSDQKENIPKDLQDNLSKNVAEDLKEREDLRQYTKRIVIRRILLKAHIIGFLFINFMLFMINNLSGNFSFTNYQWWPWVFTGWGVPIAFHMFFYYHKNPLTPYTVHRFTFITISIYMVFIDLYSDYSLSWSWIPILCWGGLFLIHRLAKQDSKKHEVEVTIYGLIISDQSGRVLVDVVLDKETIKEKLNLEEEGLEMVGMFINAIQSFSYE